LLEISKKVRLTTGIPDAFQNRGIDSLQPAGTSCHQSCRRYRYCSWKRLC